MSTLVLRILMWNELLMYKKLAWVITSSVIYSPLAWVITSSVIYSPLIIRWPTDSENLVVND